MQRSAACDKLCGGLMEFVSEYEATKQDLLNGPFSEGVLTPILDAWEKQIYNATLEAAKKHDDAIVEFVWNQNMKALRESLDFARN